MIVVFTSTLNVEPLVVLTILAIVYGVGANEDPVFVVNTVNQGFGDTTASIANVIFAGCIVSIFLKESNSAQGFGNIPHHICPFTLNAETELTSQFNHSYGHRTSQHCWQRQRRARYGPTWFCGGESGIAYGGIDQEIFVTPRCAH